MKVVLIDNYDSFTYILAQYLREQAGVQLTIMKNDAFVTDALADFDAIVISPGPGLPSDGGHILEVIKVYSGSIPILGICLGLQAIYESFGGQLTNLSTVQHGVTSKVSILDPGDSLFNNVSDPFEAGRYHSWVGNPDTLPESLRITALDQHGNIMACRHISHPTYGVQFHPESILTPSGLQIIHNFVGLIANKSEEHKMLKQ